MGSRLYSAREAADYLGVAYSRVRAFIAEGRIKVVKVGAVNAIYRSELDRFKAKPRKDGRPKGKK